MLTLENLKDSLFYDPLTGLFTWIKPNAYNVKKGQPGGWQHKSGYIYITFNNIEYKAHRLAWFYMTGSWPVNFIDHINRIPNDNRFENLRCVTPLQNSQNKSINKNNKSATSGVNWHKATNKWRAYITFKGKQNHLGLFKNKDDALMVIEQKRKELFTHYESKA